jgi:hypothetical protein
MEDFACLSLVVVGVRMQPFSSQPLLALKHVALNYIAGMSRQLTSTRGSQKLRGATRVRR